MIWWGLGESLKPVLTEIGPVKEWLRNFRKKGLGSDRTDSSWGANNYWDKTMNANQTEGTEPSHNITT